ncbi:hypothetical protein GCM10022267_34420 [Lentzea roselyniae]|uniref:Uncharacterized protein n=1 Tax=Lentzea roselyniae TaxID=531940 RepID=A0ABP7B1E0_9PSEU
MARSVPGSDAFRRTFFAAACRRGLSTFGVLGSAEAAEASPAVVKANRVTAVNVAITFMVRPWQRLERDGQVRTSRLLGRAGDRVYV